MMDKEKLQKLRVFDRARRQIEELIFQCDTNAMCSEEIECALEDLVIAIPKLKEYWDNNIKVDDK